MALSQPNSGTSEASASRGPAPGNLPAKPTPKLSLVAWQHCRFFKWFCCFNLRRCAGIADCILKTLGPLLILFALCLIGEVTYAYFVYVLPNSGLSLLPAFFQTATGCFILYNIVFSYVQAVRIDPGIPPTQGEVQASIEAGTFMSVFNLPLPMEVCHKCDRVKVPRSHHCSVCRRCVLKMDHHCPWLNQCVGYFNYRYFLLFLLWLALGCVFTLATFLPLLAPTMFYQEPWMIKPAHSMQFVSFGAILSFAMTIAMLLLGGFHFMLLLRNCTTIEFQSSYNARSASETRKALPTYSVGWRLNLQQVLGSRKFPLNLMPFLKGPGGTGWHFVSPSAQPLSTANRSSHWPTTYSQVPTTEMEAVRLPATVSNAGLVELAVSKSLQSTSTFEMEDRAVSPLSKEPRRAVASGISPRSNFVNESVEHTDTLSADALAYPADNTKDV